MAKKARTNLSSQQVNVKIQKYRKQDRTTKNLEE